MKRITLTFLVLMAFGTIFAQTKTPQYPSYYEQFWNHYHHADNATITGELWIDDVLQEGLNWEIGAYDLDGEWSVPTPEVVGGIVADIYASKPYPLYFLLYNGEPGDRIIFKLYDHLTETETDYVCSFDTTFVVNGQLGIPSNPFQFRFYTKYDMVFEGIEDNLWSNPANWTADGAPVGRIPLYFEDVTIAAPCTLDIDAEVASVTINSGNSLTIVETELTSEITIKDGAQLFAPEGSSYSGTFEKDILGYGSSTYGNYYFLSIPVADFNIETDFATSHMLNGDYDLYFFTQNPDNAGEIDPEDNETWYLGEWQNYKFYMNPDYGMEGFTDSYQLNQAYLYANSQNITLEFDGTFYSGNGQYTCLNASGSEWPGYQLVGNPFPCNATITAGNKIGGYYMMNENGRSDVIAVEDPVVAPATALLIQSAGGNPATQRRVTFVPSQEEATVRNMGNARINIEVLSDGVLQDRAYVRMYESENLDKYSLRNDGAKLFIPQNGKKYAAVYAGEAKVMPVSFTATENGSYTLNVNPENMTCNYLHLIDNMTGTDVDLLSTSTYTFEAKNTDYSSRFKLIFAEESTNEIAESFVYINNGNLIINNDGAAKLQLMDATGRILSAEDINGSYSKSLNLSAGVYIVRLLNGVDVKTQKIVVE